MLPSALFLELGVAAVFLTGLAFGSTPINQQCHNKVVTGTALNDIAGFARMMKDCMLLVLHAFQIVIRLHMHVLLFSLLSLDALFLGKQLILASLCKACAFENSKDAALL